MAGLSNNNLSNTQAAYRFYNERFMAGLHSRAQNLWTDGYRVTPQENDLEGDETAAPATCFSIYKEDTDNNGYVVDPIQETCTCTFFLSQQSEPLTESEVTVPCKHLLGLKTLVDEEIAYWTMKAAYTADYRREIEYVRIIRGLTETLKRVGK